MTKKPREEIGSRLIIVAVVLTTNAGADCMPASDIDSAVRIVRAASPAVLAARELYQAKAKARPWDAYVRVGYSIAGTQIDAEGLNASVQVKIPLFSNAERVAGAAARREWVTAREQTATAFLSEIERLCGAIAERETGDAMRPVYSDHLAYTERRVNEQAEEPGALWRRIEQLQQSKANGQKRAEQIGVMRQAIARRFGGRRWRSLIRLLPR